jgi:hypothetical protein
MLPNFGHSSASSVPKGVPPNERSFAVNFSCWAARYVERELRFKTFTCCLATSTNRGAVKPLKCSFRSVNGDNDNASLTHDE